MGALPLLVLLGAMAAAACGGSNPRLPPAGLMSPDQWLYERGTEALNERKWYSAREYFRRLVDGYPQSPHREAAKLGIGDSYIGDGGLEANVLAINELREFIQFFPVSPRGDYAQYRMAYAYSKQMLHPQRDQTSTHDTIREVETFLQRYPDSQYRDEIQAIERDARDRLSQAEYEIGYFYARFGGCEGAISRFRGILVSDPAFTNRDAVYFQMAECLLRSGRPAEALPWYERVLSEFQQSAFIERSKRRVAELKTVALASAGSAGSAGNSRPPTATR